MSSYGVGGVDIVDGLAGGVISIGAALAVLTPVAAGYGWYKAGEAVKDSLVRQHQEALELQYREKAQARERIEKAKKVRQKIIEQCSKYIIECKEDTEGLSNSISELAKELVNELENINSEIEMDISSLEMKNYSDINRIKKLVDRYKTQRNRILEKEKNGNEMLSFFEVIDSLFETIVTSDFSFVHNVEIMSEKRVKLKKLYDKKTLLEEEFYTIINREIDRYGNYPISAISIDRMATLFSDIREEIMNLQYEEEEWIYEERLQSISKGIESYYTYKALLDKEQEKFMDLYLRYIKSYEGMGEDYKDAVEFDSYEELEKEVNYRIKQLERMKVCSELYSELGKEAYICMAFEKELNNLNYSVENKDVAEQLLHRKLQYAMVANKKIPFYRLEKNSITRIFKVNDDVGLQLIVHSDGSSTMETIALTSKADNKIVEIQKEHCKKTKLLEKRMKENWFVVANFTESMSADNITFEFSTNNENTTFSENEHKYYLKKRQELARKEQKKKNANKARNKSLALHY